MSDDGFREIQLSGKQLVFLFMATTVVSIVIFLCGVLVGRGVPAEAGLGSPVAAVESAGTAVPVAALPRRSMRGASDGLPSALDEELTYPARLEGPETASEMLRVDEPPPVVSEELPPGPLPEPPREETAPAGAGLADADGFTVQVAALRQRAEAVAVMERLSARGYPAYVLDPAPGAPASVYRVRVGRYAERRDAEQMMLRLEQEERFKPWITR